MIAVLDYGIGNLRSAEKALQRVGGDARLVTDAGQAEGANGVVLPGVGAFGRCAEALRDSGLDKVALDAADRGVPFLGICVGMQLLYDGSDEDPEVPGLGVLHGRVRLLPEGVKRPQMQWNRLDLTRPDDPLLSGLGVEPWVYFVHSYAADATGETIATCDYGGPVTAVVGRPGLWATQFHPEKSGVVGLRILANFVAAAASGVVMELLPAIDIRAGRCVRLVEGDFDRETVYSSDPIAVARSFADAGARLLHLVDLDAARGTGDNRQVIVRIAAEVPVALQVGGGVRDGSLLEMGVARVVVGSLAVEDPVATAALADAHPGQVAVSVDHRGGEVRVRGWKAGAGLGVGALLARLETTAVAAVIVTEIGRDGTLAGPDVAGLSRVLAETELPVIASGGVSTLEDLRALSAVRAGDRRLAGVIVGKALYEGRFGVAEALRAVAA